MASGADTNILFLLTEFPQAILGLVSAALGVQVGCSLWKLDYTEEQGEAGGIHSILVSGYT